MSHLQATILRDANSELVAKGSTVPGPLMILYMSSCGSSAHDIFSAPVLWRAGP